MPLKGKPSTTDAAGDKAAQTFEKLTKSFGDLPSTTETISFRVPRGEKLRLRNLFARKGLTLAQGIKHAVYAYTTAIEQGQKGNGI